MAGLFLTLLSGSHGYFGCHMVSYSLQRYDVLWQREAEFV